MRVAVAQAPGVRLEDWRQTLALVDDLIGQAAGLHSELVLLPECVWPAYCLGSRQHYRDARAGGLPGPSFLVSRLRRTAQKQHIRVCAGFVGEDGDRLLNSACLIGADGGLIGTRDKHFLWAFDHDWFEPGRRIEPLTTDLGRVGLMICADARLPEISATLAASGAELMLQPTAWVNVGSSDNAWNPQPDFMISARAEEFGVPFASASKWGSEAGTEFVGSSLICDADGKVLAQCGQAETTVIAADIEPSRPKPLALTPDDRAALLSTRPPTLPRADVGPLAVLPLPPGADGPRHWRDTVPAMADELPLLAVHCDEADSSSIRSPQRPTPNKALVSGPTSEPLELAGVAVGSVAGAAAGSFAPIRVLALRGVHVVVVFWPRCSLNILKTRACENRVFLFVVGPVGLTVVNPSGETTVAPHRSPPVVVEISVAEAARKCVADRTNMIADRQPSCYAL